LAYSFFEQLTAVAVLILSSPCLLVTIVTADWTAMFFCLTGTFAYVSANYCFEVTLITFGQQGIVKIFNNLIACKTVGKP
jgi:hypothetical protein